MAGAASLRIRKEADPRRLMLTRMCRTADLLGFESARNDEPFIVFGDAGQACRTAAAVRLARRSALREGGSTPAHNTGKRGQRFTAATSVHAFWLSRINNGVLCRATDVASS